MIFHSLKIVCISIRLRGLLATLKLIYAEITLDKNIKKHTSGMRRLSDLTLIRNDINDCMDYMPSNPFFLDGIFDFISNNYDLRKMDFLDYGSGMGRVLYFAQKYNFKKYVGIEISKELCDMSNHFFKTQGIEDIKIINIDASKYRVDDDINIFYLNNSFTGDVFNDVLDNIDHSFNRLNRTILLIYLNPICMNIVAERGSYNLIYNVNNNGHNEVAIFERKTCT